MGGQWEGGGAPCELKYASRSGECEQVHDTEAEKAEKKGAGREGDRQPENDLDHAAEATLRLAEREGQARHDNDDDGDDLGDRALDGFQDLLQRFLPRHPGSGGMGGRRDREAEQTGGRRNPEWREIGDAGKAHLHSPVVSGVRSGTASTSCASRTATVAIVTPRPTRTDKG